MGCQVLRLQWIVCAYAAGVVMYFQWMIMFITGEWTWSKPALPWSCYDNKLPWSRLTVKPFVFVCHHSYVMLTRNQLSVFCSICVCCLSSVPVCLGSARSQMLVTELSPGSFGAVLPFYFWHWHCRCAVDAMSALFFSCCSCLIKVIVPRP